MVDDLGIPLILHFSARVARQRSNLTVDVDLEVFGTRQIAGISELTVRLCVQESEMHPNTLFWIGLYKP